MTRIIALAFALGLGGVARASDDEAVDPAKVGEVRATPTGQVYDVPCVKTEGGLCKASATKDGQRLEIHLNDALEIVKTLSADCAAIAPARPGARFG